MAAHAYYRLIDVAHHWPRIEQSRAALALGYYQFQQSHYPQARVWFREARGDPVLRDYALYWDGLAAASANQDQDAITLLGEYLHDYPASVVEKSALEAYADSAMDAKKPGLALTALRAYRGSEDSSHLLVRIALAEEMTGDLNGAALNFQRVYNLFPFSDAAPIAYRGIERLRARLGRRFPNSPLADRILRARTLYRHGQWRKAERAWEPLLDSLAGTERDKAALRVAECESRLTNTPGALETLTLTDPTLNAERWIALFNVYWNRNDENRMKVALAKVIQLSTSGAPAEMADHALFMMGNYYWANVKWDQAIVYYRQLTARKVTGFDALTANWRIAWTAYLDHSPDAARLMREYIEEYPDSHYVPDALYWLGRLAQRAGNLALASSYYGKASSRYAETYFGRQAREQASQIAAQSDPPAAALALFERIPAIKPMASLNDAVPADVHTRYERAVALQSIAFDNSAMLEYRVAYAVSKAPQMLIDAARAAQSAKLYLTGAALMRELVPDLESRPMNSVPLWVWRIVYPLPMKPLIEHYADHYDFDPMLYASLIRQESGFEPAVVSSAGAVGLAQLEPYTALKWSRILHIWYSYRRLSDPRYNLTVSSAYFHALMGMFGKVALAVAAYNAGEDRVAAWQEAHHFDSVPEFVESIPFSQTRHYVEVVLSGAAIYRHIYEDHP